MSPPLLATLLLLSACGPGQVSTGDTPPAVDPAPPVDTAPVDTAPVEPIEDAGENPAPTAPVVVFDPPAGTFVDPIDVTVQLQAGEQAWYTTDGSLPTSRDEPYTAPLSVRDGVELRVLVRNEAGLESVDVASYVQVSDTLAAFDSNLPLLVLYAEDDLDNADGGYLSVAFQVHDRGADGRATLVGPSTLASRAAIRVRGSSTAYDPKHSYALELRERSSDDDANREVLGMPAESDWVLYAPLGFDRALLRNALVYRLSNDAGRYAPRTRFVEVFSVGRGGRVDETDYVGVYTLMESIKRAPDRVDIQVLAPEDLAPPEVTGGYLFKRDRVGDFEYGFDAGTADGTFAFDDPLVYVDPEEDVIEREQATYLADTIDTMAYALAAPDGTYGGRHYSTLLDVDAFIDHHILNLYPKNPDALRLSSYLHKDRDGLVVAGPVWDFDRTMGCDDDDRAEDPTWWDPTNQTWDTTPMFTYGWYGALFDDPTFTAAYWARFDALLDDTLSVAHVDGIIDEMAAELAEAAPRNFARWPDYPPRGGSYDAEVELLRTWLFDRHAWIRTCLTEHPEDPERCTGE